MPSRARASSSSSGRSPRRWWDWRASSSAPACRTVRGDGRGGRWLALGFITLQPSELAKFVVVAASAAILSRNARLVHDPLRMVAPLLLVVGPMAILIMLQPDLGTTMVVTAIVFLSVFVVGVRL